MVINVAKKKVDITPTLFEISSSKVTNATTAGSLFNGLSASNFEIAPQWAHALTIQYKVGTGNYNNMAEGSNLVAFDATITYKISGTGLTQLISGAALSAGSWTDVSSGAIELGGTNANDISKNIYLRNLLRVTMNGATASFSEISNTNTKRLSCSGTSTAYVYVAYSYNSTTKTGSSTQTLIEKHLQ